MKRAGWAIKKTGAVFTAAAVVSIAIGMMAISGGYGSRVEMRTLPTDFALPAEVHASSVLETVQLTMKERVQLSRSVVLVKCTGRSVNYGPGGNIFTFYSFETEEAVKGEPRSAFQIRFLGGSLDGVTVSLPIDHEFQPGDEYVLLLGRDNSDGFATLDPVAVFTAKTEPASGRRVVVPGPGDLPLYEKSSGNLMKSSGLGWSFLDDFLFSVRKALQ